MNLYYVNKISATFVVYNPKSGCVHDNFVANTHIMHFYIIEKKE